MRFHDCFNGLFFIALGLAVFLLARGFPQMPGQVIGPATFPTLIGLGMMVGGGVTALLPVWKKQAAPLLSVDAGWRQPRHLTAALFLLLGTLALGLGFEQIGFPLGGLLLIGGLYWFSGLRGPLFWLLALAFVLVVTLVMTRLLYVPLPLGVLFSAWGA